MVESDEFIGITNARATSVSAADMTVTTITFGVNWSY